MTAFLVSHHPRELACAVCLIYSIYRSFEGLKLPGTSKCKNAMGKQCLVVLSQPSQPFPGLVTAPISIRRSASSIAIFSGLMKFTPRALVLLASKRGFLPYPVLQDKEPAARINSCCRIIGFSHHNIRYTSMKKTDLVAFNHYSHNMHVPIVG